MSYIKLDRAIKNWRYKTKPEYVALWLEILISANWESKKWFEEELSVGEFITSREHLAESTGLSVQQVRTILKKLDNEEIIVKSTNKYTKISVIKWEEYQCYEENQPTTNQQLTNNQPTTNQQLTTTKEYKNNKNIKNNKNSMCKPTLNEVIEYCLERNNNVDPERFIDFYESKGWKVGNQPMKDWKAAIRTWEKRNTPIKQSYEDTLPTYDTSNNPDVDMSRLDEILRKRENNGSQK